MSGDAIGAIKMAFDFAGHRLKEHDDILMQLASRVTQLEKHIQYPNTKLKEQAAQLQATEHLYAPLRNDTKAVLDLAAFARRLLEYDDLGQQCSAAVRDAAREALGMKKVET